MTHLNRLHFAFPSRARTRRWDALVLAGLICMAAGIGEEAAAQQGGEVNAAKSSANPSQLSDISEQEFQLRSRPLLGGMGLAGWEGHAYWFAVEGEAVVAGRLDQPILKNQFLCTVETFDDFDLRLEVRLRGRDPNAGVQFRSRRPRANEGLPSNEVIGYQADLGTAGGRSVWGALYDESRRNKMLAQPQVPFDAPWTKPPPEADIPRPESTAKASEPDQQAASVPQTAWVRMRIVCRGDRIEIFLNETLTVRYTETDPDIPRVGTIGLQIHSGPPAEAWYRNIRIVSLREEDAERRENPPPDHPAPTRE